MSTAKAVSTNLLETVLKLLHMYSAAPVAFVAPPSNELRLAAEQTAEAMVDVIVVCEASMKLLNLTRALWGSSNL